MLHTVSDNERSEDEMRLRRKAKLFRDAGVASMIDAVQLHNSPTRTGEAQVLLLLGHSIEMLLKAVIFQRRGTVTAKGEDLSHSLTKCIDIAISDLGVLGEDDRVLLLALKSDRGQAAHDVVAASEDLLWVHIRAALEIFRRVHESELGGPADEFVSKRVLPISAAPPTHAPTLIQRDVEEISAMLRGGKRRGAEARARIRPLLALEAAVHGREEPPSEREIERAARSIKRGTAWDKVFPGLAGLEVTGVPAEPAGAAVSLRISKDGEAAVRRARPDEEAEALLYREVNVFDKYGLKLSQFGDKLGLTSYEGLAVVYHLGLTDDPHAYYVKRTANGNIQFQGLSARALHIAREALAEHEGFVTEAVRAYKAR